MIFGLCLVFVAVTIAATASEDEVAQDVALLENLLPSAVDRAMSSLSTHLKKETEWAFSLKGVDEKSSRPFKFVQLFLRTKTLAKQLGISSYVLLTAAHLLIVESGIPRSRVLSILRNMASPLPPPLVRPMKPDEPFSVSPDLDRSLTCPWAAYAPCETGTKYRSFDGSCNNLIRPILGRSLTPFERFLPPDYGDGLDTLRLDRNGKSLPSARLVSATIVEDMDRPDSTHSLMLMLWGQFIDHDISLTAISKTFADGHMNKTLDIKCGSNRCSAKRNECQPIQIPPNDSSFAANDCLEFVRSQSVPNLNCSMGPRQQLNQVTAYIDASTVYGSTKEHADKIRNLSDTNRGRLKYTHHPSDAKYKYLLPQMQTLKQCRDFDSEHLCFMAGDERVNEQSILAMMHTAWMREHNRIEAVLHRLNGGGGVWNGEQLFQETRKILGAMMQHVTFNEFLPIVLGPELLKQYGLDLLQSGHYHGYDATSDASVRNVFATAAFRFGHTLLPSMITRADSNYNTTGQRSLHLSELLNRPKSVYSLEDGGMDSLVRGLASQRIQQFDRFVTKEVTVHLFAESPPHGLGLDLVSINIQRGRDHGIPGYNKWRKWCDLPVAKDFDDLVDISDRNVINKFKSIYSHVDDLDLFPAAIAERSVDSGLVGRTFGCIIGRQFQLLRKADRFWYENQGENGFSLEQLEQLRKVSLAKVLCQNSDNITQIQPNVMQLPFRQIHPKRWETQSSNSGMQSSRTLSAEWFQRLWLSDYNARIDCDDLSDVDFTKWKVERTRL